MTSLWLNKSASISCFSSHSSLSFSFPDHFMEKNIAKWPTVHERETQSAHQQHWTTTTTTTMTTTTMTTITITTITTTTTTTAKIATLFSVFLHISHKEQLLNYVTLQPFVWSPDCFVYQISCRKCCLDRNRRSVQSTWQQRLESCEFQHSVVLVQGLVHI